MKENPLQFSVRPSHPFRESFNYSTEYRMLEGQYRGSHRQAFISGSSGNYFEIELILEPSNDLFDVVVIDLLKTNILGSAWGIIEPSWLEETLMECIPKHIFYFQQLVFWEAIVEKITYDPKGLPLRGQVMAMVRKSVSKALNKVDKCEWKTARLVVPKRNDRGNVF